MNCSKCPYGGNTVGTKGNPDSPFVIVGESPGPEELEEGIPFVGPSGKLLDLALIHAKKALPNLPEPYVTNTCKCLPTNKTGSVVRQAIKSCRPQLIEELRHAPRTLVITLGNWALWSTTADFNKRITQAAGSPRLIGETFYIPLFHPSWILRGNSTSKEWVKDFVNACKVAFGGDDAPIIPLKDPMLVKTRVLTKPEHIHSLYKMALQKGFAMLDLETTNIDFQHDEIICLVVALEEGTSYIIPFTLLEYARPIIEDRRIRCGWQKGQFDYKFLHINGYDAHIDEDVMLLHYATNETPGTHDLDTMGMMLYGLPIHKHMLDEYLPSRSASFANIPLPVLYDYAGKDGHKQLFIYNRLRPEVAEDGPLNKLYTKVLIPATAFLARMEMRGVKIDIDVARENDLYLRGQIAASLTCLMGIVKEHWTPRAIKAYMHLKGAKAPPTGFPLGKVFDAAEMEYLDDLKEVGGFNPGSSKQISFLLYNILKMPPVHLQMMHAKEWGTGIEILHNLPDHPIKNALIAFRQAVKNRSTYVLSYLRQMDEKEIVHSSISLTTTPTGRLASSDPGLHQLPRESRIRSIIRARDDMWLLEGDYNQAELRVLTVVSGDPVLLRIYTEGGNIHKETAVGIFGEGYSDQQYARAKAVNFGIVYGRTGKSFAEEFHTTVSEGDRWVKGWIGRFPVAAAFLENKCRKAARIGSFLQTPMGRRRRFPKMKGSQVVRLENQAANFPPQSIASDCTLLAAIAAEEELLAIGCHIILLVHDAIIVETPPDIIIARIARDIIKHYMTKIPKEWLKTDVPFLTDFKLSYNWGKGKSFA